MKHALWNRIGWAVLALGLPISALADVTGTKTLTTTTGALNLDSGATAASGGDILWNGTTITPQGTAKDVSLGPLGSLASLSKAVLDPFKLAAGSAPIPAIGLTVGNVFAVFTNGGNSAAVLVTANSGGSITLQFITYGATGGGGPTITKVVNNSSNIPAGFPNSGISPSSLFKVLGSGFGDPNDVNNHPSEGAGLQTTLNGASVSVTVGSTTVHPALYYAGPTSKPDSDDSSTPRQLSAVLPAATPVGNGTVTVTFNGTPSNSFPIQVVAAAPGITTYNNGATVVAQDFARPTDPYGGLVTFQKSAVPGGIVTIWGSGFGARGNSDTTYDTSSHQTSVPYQIYIGGVLVTNLAYKGASVYPGVDIFVLTIPTSVPTGCYVPVAAVGTVNGISIVSNIATLPIKAGGGQCSDPQFGIGPPSGDSVKSGFLVVAQSTSPGSGVSNNAAAIFQQSSSVSAPGGGGIVSIGGCILTQTITGGPTGTTTGLNAGTITVTGPGQSPVTLTGNSLLPGFYFATLASIPSTGGAFVFNGTAGSQVGAFTGTVNFPNPLLVWTNQGSAATVTRSGGFTVTWSGGSPGSFVIITGTATSGSASGTFTCYAPQSALTFTVPSYVLLGLPAGTGSTMVTNSTNLGTFSAQGLDFGATLGSVSFSVNSNYN